LVLVAGAALTAAACGGGSTSGFSKDDLPRITAVRPPRPGGVSYLPAQAPKRVDLNTFFNTTYASDADQAALTELREAGFVDAYLATWTGTNNASAFAFLLKREPRAPRVLAALRHAFVADFGHFKVKPIPARGLGAAAWGERSRQGDFIYGFRSRNLVVVVAMNHGRRNPTEDEAIRYAKAVAAEAAKQKSA
jgi:hypothetical protein